jgi:tRNA-(ms[2]io[6]A)-hydroxylase
VTGLAITDAVELRWATPAEWAERIGERPLALLSDHAHCELGAAATAQALIVRNPEETAMVKRLTSHALEELEHFKRVHRLLVRLGGRFEPACPNPYMDGLFRACAPTRTSTRLDRLLTAAVIERRSLERFELLAEHLTGYADGAISALFASLAPSEAGHALLFVHLARELHGAEAADARLARIAELEGRVVSGLPFDWRVHSGIA